MWEQLKSNRAIHFLICLTACLTLGLVAARFLAPVAWRAQTITGALILGITSGVAVTIRRRSATHDAEIPDQYPQMQGQDLLIILNIVHDLDPSGEPLKAAAKDLLGFVKPTQPIEKQNIASEGYSIHVLEQISTQGAIAEHWAIKDSVGTTVADLLEVAVPLSSANAPPAMSAILESLGLSGKGVRRWDLLKEIKSGDIPQQPTLKSALLCCRIGDLKTSSSKVGPDVLSVATREVLGIRKALRSKFPMYLALTGLEAMDGVNDFNDFARFMGESRRDVLVEAVGTTASSRTSLDEVIRKLKKWRPAVLDSQEGSSRRQLGTAVRLFSNPTDRAKEVNKIRTQSAMLKATLYEFPRQLGFKSELIARFCSQLVGKTVGRDGGPILRGVFYTGLLVPEAGGGTVDERSLTPNRVFAWHLLTHHFLAGAAGGRLPDQDGLRAYRDLQPRIKNKWLSAFRAASITLAALLICALISITLNGMDVYQARTLISRLRSALTNESGLGVSELKSLGEIRSRLQEVDSGAPLLKTFGFYQGHRISRELTSAYYQGAAMLLVTPVLNRLDEDLKSRTTGDGNLGKVEQIKLYEMLHRKGCPADRAFLTRWAPYVWSRAEKKLNESESTGLAEAEFSYLADPANFVRVPEDRLPTWNEAAVANALERQQPSGQFEAIYSTLIRDVNGERVNLTEVLPDEPDRAQHLLQQHGLTMLGPTEMGAAYSAKNFVRTAEAVQNWQGKEGSDPCFPAAGSRLASSATLDNASAAHPLMRYSTEYKDHWKAFLAAAKIKDFTLSTASNELGMLAGERSPLLATLAFVSYNTSVPETHGSSLGAEATRSVAKVFAPVVQIVPPGTDRWTSGWWNETYRKYLLDLKSAMANVSDRPSDKTAVEAARKVCDNGEGVVDLLRFPSGTEGVDQTLKDLLKAPFVLARKKLPEEGPKEIDAILTALCHDVHRVQIQDAKVDLESLKRLFDQQNAAYLQFQSAGFVQRPPGTDLWQAGPRSSDFVLNAAFLPFLNELSARSKFWSSDVRNPGFDLTIEVIPDPAEMSSIVKIGGATGEKRTGDLPNILHFRWPGPNPGAGFELVTPGAVIDYSGIWGLYNMIRNSNRDPNSSNTIIISKQQLPSSLVQLRDGGRSAKVALRFQTIPGGFEGPLSGIRCPAVAARR